MLLLLTQLKAAVISQVLTTNLGSTNNLGYIHLKTKHPSLSVKQGS